MGSDTMSNEILRTLVTFLWSRFDRMAEGRFDWFANPNPTGLPYLKHTTGMEVHVGWNHTDGLRFRVVDRRGNSFVKHLWRPTIDAAFTDAERMLNAERRVDEVLAQLDSRTVPVEKMTITELLQSICALHLDPRAHFARVRDEIVRRQNAMANDAVTEHCGGESADAAYQRGYSEALEAAAKRCGELAAETYQRGVRDALDAAAQCVLESSLCLENMSTDAIDLVASDIRGLAVTPKEG